MTPDEQPQPVAWRWFLAPTGRDIDDGDYFVAHWAYGDKPDPDEVCEPLYAHPPISAASQPDAVTLDLIKRAAFYGWQHASWDWQNVAMGCEEAAPTYPFRDIPNPPAESSARRDVPNATPKAEADPFADKYHELLMAVASKFPGESRHATALRYINERENLPTHGPAQNATPTSGGGE